MNHQVQVVANLSHIGAVLRTNSRFLLPDSCISFFPLRKALFTQLVITLFVPGFCSFHCSWVITSGGKSLVGMVLQIQKEELKHIMYYKPNINKKITTWLAFDWVDQIGCIIFLVKGLNRCLQFLQHISNFFTTIFYPEITQY